ncbi:hypothetical protein [Roseovarius indicus]|uniref:hypothetical protein n=1 Tax=Roseovarius indicus TaxID=540747 RepID=UPI0007D99C23|nr:hypothetical protein [Roseovarius indicus]OAN98870.1 hypothetical protein A8B76_22195 [Roseovarius indicus]
MTRMLAILVFAAAVAFAASPLFVRGFDGFDPGQFPIPQENPPAQPAGYAFSIWFLIYAWMIAGTGYGLFWRADDPRWAAHRAPLFISLAVGTAWLPVAVVSPLAATALLWVILGSALAALMQTGRSDRLWLQAPIAVFAGWLTAAACTGLGLLLAGYGVAYPQGAALFVLVLALLLASAVLAMRPGTPEYGAAVIWALVGVAVGNLEPMNPAVLGLAAAGIAGLGVMMWRTA